MIPNLPIAGETPAPTRLDIQLCETHAQELCVALALRGMEKYVRLDDEQRKLLAELGQSDPLTVSRLQLAMSAVQTFGTEFMRTVHGCPVCAFHSVVTVIADAMALQFTKGH